MTACRRAGWVALATLTILTAPAAPARADTDAPPATLLSGKPVHGAAIDPVFASFKLKRMSCKFSEEKHIALLARPLRSTGTIHFDRDRGIAKTTLTPKPQTVILTTTSLQIRDGKRIEEIPFDKSKDLKALVLVFATFLRGDRTELEGSFKIGMYGNHDSWWALEFTPKSESLRKLVRRVVVFGRKNEVVSLQVNEASNDTTHTRLTEIFKNGDVPDARIATAFGTP